MSDKNKTKKLRAVALSYDVDKLGAPKVVAKGKGNVATNIIEKAKEHQVPIQEDSSLVELLSQLQINETIPEQLYSAVAEVFAFVYRVDRHHSKSDLKYKEKKSD
ncbi:MAG: EscU/YscU/HrcU family type III secretion system export apparatus switch protein [Bacillus sp. (in: Bacteria)]|nr:EscU/YscU/HrcU family type III secretion system export apparatus switch protein [Bacillus sp. (in: firmicutes)]